MALPQLIKTWSISSNNIITPKTSYLLFQKTLFLNIINFFKASGWTVRAASNGSTASTSNDITNNSTLIWNYGGSPYGGPRAHSWIVLRNTALSETYDIVLDFMCVDYQGITPDVDAYAGCVYMGAAPGGYNVTGSLSTLTRPTATNSDEFTIANNVGNYAGGMFGYSNNVQIVWNGWSSSDKQSTRMTFYMNNVLTGFLAIDRLSNPVSGWTVPVVGTWNMGNGSSISCSGYYSNTWLGTRINGKNISCYMSSEGYGSNQLSTNLPIPNEINGEHPISPIGVVSTTAPFRGRHGGLSDLWYSGGLKNGATFTDTSGNPRMFVYNNGFVLPWNGSLPVTQ